MLERDWFDFVSLGLSVATLAVTGFGLFFVIASLKQTARQQRTEAGPYVRVDIGSEEEEMLDFEKPGFTYHDSQQATGVVAGQEGQDVVTISAWFRNYQAHPLGMAFGVSAVFLIEVSDSEPVINEVRIAYLEAGKPVLVDIARIPRSIAATVRLVGLSFHDLYDLRHEHTYGAKGTNALHGRMICEYANNRFTAVPDGRSRGNGVDFG